MKVELTDEESKAIVGRYRNSHERLAHMSEIIQRKIDQALAGALTRPPSDDLWPEDLEQITDKDSWNEKLEALQSVVNWHVHHALAQAAPKPVTEEEAREIYLELTRKNGEPATHWDALGPSVKCFMMRQYDHIRGIKPEEPIPTTDPYDAVLTILDKRGAELPEVRRRLEELLTAEQRVKALEQKLAKAREAVGL